MHINKSVQHDFLLLFLPSAHTQTYISIKTTGNHNCAICRFITHLILKDFNPLSVTFLQRPPKPCCWPFNSLEEFAHPLVKDVMFCIAEETFLAEFQRKNTHL